MDTSGPREPSLLAFWRAIGQALSTHEIAPTCQTDAVYPYPIDSVRR